VHFGKAQTYQLDMSNSQGELKDFEKEKQIICTKDLSDGHDEKERVKKLLEE